MYDRMKGIQTRGRTSRGGKQRRIMRRGNYDSIKYVNEVIRVKPVILYN